MNTKTKEFSIWLKFRTYIEEFILKFRASNGSSSEEPTPSEEAGKQEEKLPPQLRKKRNKQEKNKIKAVENMPSKDFEKGDKAFLDKKAPEPEAEKEKKQKKAKLPFPKNIKKNKAYRWPDVLPPSAIIKNELMIVPQAISPMPNVSATAVPISQAKVLSERFVASVYILACVHPVAGLILNIVGYMRAYHQEQNFVAKYIRFNLNVFISALVYYVFVFNVLELNPSLDKIYLEGPREGFFAIFFGQYSWMWIGIYLLLGFNLCRALKGKLPLHLIALPILRK